MITLCQVFLKCHRILNEAAVPTKKNPTEFEVSVGSIRPSGNNVIFWTRKNGDTQTHGQFLSKTRIVSLTQVATHKKCLKNVH